ncbi:MAG: bifunctional DNA-formamidopyrimidine glycosylase/DNA-(apurinic or apyrimidinic site) lyase [Pseudomonadota bacterium]
MPELPEVETTRRGIEDAVVGREISDWVVRDARLRWPVELPEHLRGRRMERIDRRGKYLLLRCEGAGLIVHLGMSGSLRVVPADTPPRKHDHIDLVLDDDSALRLHDPRRFGSVHYLDEPLERHFLLANLGVEPLGEAFDGAHLKALARGKRVAVKNFIMNSAVVVGVGNIYANEALFLAGIRPTVPAGSLSLPAYTALAASIRQVLLAAIQMGGTTLRDYVGSAGDRGYFKQSLNVYGREGEQCTLCDSALTDLRLGQRATVYCPKCQPPRGFNRTRC